MTNPRIFVGTLYSGEAEFGECCDLILQQKDVEVEHVVISHLPELEAHNALWAAWNAAKHCHDLFAKIDADTVLINGTALRRVFALFAADRRVTGAQLLLHDYFADQLIAGVNFFSPAVIFRKANNRLFCDRVDSNHDKVLKGDAVVYLAPIGYHCKYPHALQAFHFGLHRGLKKQHQVIGEVARAWQARQDEARMWALAGAMSASLWRRHSSDYTDAWLHKAFDRLKRDPSRLEKVKKFARRLQSSRSCFVGSRAAHGAGSPAPPQR